jgi:hypothetical protein
MGGIMRNRLYPRLQVFIVRTGLCHREFQCLLLGIMDNFLRHKEEPMQTHHFYFKANNYPAFPLNLKGSLTRLD